MKAILTWMILILVSILGIGISLSGLYIINTTHFYNDTLAWNPIQRELFKVLFLGDVMLDRTLRLRGEERGYEYIFECSQDIFEQYDEVVVNLEGTVTDYVSTSKNAPYLSPESFRFTFDPSALTAAVGAGITIFGLANNHIFDFGKDGIMQTISNLRQNNVSFFGNPLDDEVSQLQKVVRLQKEFTATDITIIPFNEFFGTSQETIELIQMEKAKHPHNYIVVFAHWGDEYVEPAPRVRAWARQFIDTGADLIIGMHPHVIQESEVYTDKKIYYSLGNFIFDQYWEESVRTGLGVGLTLKPNKDVLLEEILFDIDRSGQTCPRQKVMI